MVQYLSKITLSIVTLLMGATVAAQDHSAPPVKLGPSIMDNWNKGGCSFTDQVNFTLSQAEAVGQLRTWINWPQGVGAVPFMLTGNSFGAVSGVFVRRNCDSFQQTWCEGIASLSVELPAGSYRVKSSLARICQNSSSGGNGFISVHASLGRESAGAATNTNVESPSPKQPFAPAPAQPLPSNSKPAMRDRRVVATQSPAREPDSTDIRSGATDVLVGDFSKRSGPFVYTEDGNVDFSNVMAETKGIIKHRPSGVSITSGDAPPGDVDVSLFGLAEDGDIKLTLRPCSSTARMRVFDVKGNLLATSSEISWGYYGHYTVITVTNQKKGAYAVAVDYPENGTCKDGGNGWVVDAAFKFTDPIKYVGPFEEDNKPDYSVREDLDVSDLISDLQKLAVGTK